MTHQDNEDSRASDPSPLITHHSPFTTHPSPLVTHDSPPTTRRSVNETLWFQRLRWGLLKNAFRLQLGRSPGRLASIGLCCVLIWGLLFGLSLLGFRELVEDHKIRIDLPVFVLIFNLSFVSLSMLLVFSSGVILYGSLFTSTESAFLLASPIRTDQIFAYKFQGALGYSSWAFLLLGSPVLIAYGFVVNGGAPWYYFLLLPLYFLGFILIPGSVGALFCLALVNFFPRRKKQLLLGVAAVALALGAWWVYARVLPSARQAFYQFDAISEFFGAFSLVQSPFLPAYWMAQGLREAAIGEWAMALYYLALIWSNGLLLYLLTTLAARGLYRRGFNVLASGGDLRRRYRTLWLDRALAGVFGFLGRPTRLLIDKDLRTFRRDPVQWGQLLIFLGLMALIFGMMRWLYLQGVTQRFQNGVSFLFLTATSFLLCAYTGRFIYPMLSLEGRKFWILGLLPIRRVDLLRGKFAYAAVMTVSAGEALVLFSDIMLGQSWIFVLLHTTAIAVLALGLSGLSAGMGAVMPNFRETDPSKIAVGFGGTLTLVMGLLYQVAVLAVMVLPWHIVEAVANADGASLDLSRPWLWLGLAVGIALGVFAVVLPLRTGAQALEKMEF
jgi:ABC-2 type transport system permease protein